MRIAKQDGKIFELQYQFAIYILINLTRNTHIQPRHSAGAIFSIAQWLESGTEARKIFDVESANSISKGVLQDKSTLIYNLTKSRVVLVKDATQDLGFRIITAFPTI